MKKFIAILLLSLFSVSAKAQSYGNEWINYSQSYYKFKIYETGIYKIDYITLVNAGIPVTSFTSSNIQLFGKQQQIPIHIVDGGDNNFDPGDYFLFYAQKNDGWLDSTLYVDPNGIGNPSYSLYNDTINYFFTWNNQNNNLRFTIENDVNYSAVTNPANYWISKVDASYNDFYIECKDANSTSSSSRFVTGEGWASTHVNGIGGYAFNLSANTASPYNGADAPNAKFHGISVSNSNAPNNVTAGGPNHSFTWRIGNSNYILHDEQFNGYQQKNILKNFPVSILNNGNTPLSYSINQSSDYATDLQSISYWSVLYPKQPSFNGSNKDHFWIDNNPSAPKIRLDIANANLVNPVMFVFGAIPKVITMTNNGSGNWQALISNGPTGIQQEAIVQELSIINSITLLQPVNETTRFVNYNTVQNDTNVLIIIYNKQIASSAADYSNYRSSAAGGRYKVLMADVNELCLQYGGGIEKHVNGLRRFLHEIYNSATVQKPKGLLLLGKGIREASEVSVGYVAGARKNADAYNKNLVPSFGYPSSDNYITEGLENNIWEPLMATGRIAASSNQEVLEYLQKLQQYEAAQDPNSIYNTENKEWQKKILHFSGGTTASDQNEFQSYLQGMKQTIETDQFGGNVTTFKKINSNPLDPVAVAEVSERISQGVSIMNFFGHASADGFEINVDDPSNWNNEGKYPVVIGNACYTGDIFQNYRSASENFVLLPKEGAIAFISSVRVGYGFTLNYYSSELYKQFSTYSYGATVGDQIKNTVRLVRQNYDDNIYTETTCAQMVLHGDPLLRVNWHKNAEIDLTEQSIYFQPSEINLTVDSIEINVILTNLGKSITDTFTLEIKRTFPNNVDSNYIMYIPRLDYKDTVSLKVALQPSIGIGINYITVQADIPSLITEFEELTNNVVKKRLLIDIDGIVPVYPYDYAVVPKENVTVKASTINPIATFNHYRFELDTTDLFNSPQKRVAIVSGLGGVKEVAPNQWKNSSGQQSFPLICTDSTVYFWRVAVDSSTLVWRESSFQYIKGKNGWGQDHFFQFKKNTFTNVLYKRDLRQRQFDTIPRVLNVNVYDHANTNATLLGTQFEIDNNVIDYAMCGLSPSIHVAVFDPVTLKPWGKRWNGQNPDHYFGNANDGTNCRNRVEYYFIFRQNDPVQLEAFRNMIQNSVPDGYYILIYTTLTATYEYWDDITPPLAQTFQDLGATEIGNGPDKAFIFFYRKGDPNFVYEKVSTSTVNNQLINLNVHLNGYDSNGEEKSTLIGPAAKWETLYWKQHPEESNSADSTDLKIDLLDNAGGYVSSINVLMTRQDSIINLNNLIDATNYPYLQLSARYTDNVTLTPAQLDRWHVLYQPLPEAAIDGSNLYTWLPLKDSIFEGEPIKFAVDVKNISDFPMDSLLVNYWLEDANRNRIDIPHVRQDSLRVLQVMRDTIQFSTVGLKGLNSLWMEVNPYINGTLVTDQLEQFHFNNLLQIPFYIKNDNVNPILDVTFDGIHILNGDIVSPKSEIVISLKDDNPWMVMNDISDTTLFGIYLTDPHGLQKRIPFTDFNGNTVMQWIPADVQNKRFKIIFPADLEFDGKYTLMVQGADRSGNLSGDLQYKIVFEVIRTASITYMMNYPNPFSTSTRFVFTVTGVDVPDEMIIQIMTVTGKVVREITEDQIGPIHIGRNVSQYAWDGKDEFGDQLANGVYLYRVLTQLKGEDIKHRTSGADQYFKKEFGKMYLMR